MIGQLLSVNVTVTCFVSQVTMTSSRAEGRMFTVNSDGTSVLDQMPEGYTLAEPLVVPKMGQAPGESRALGEGPINPNFQYPDAYQ